MEYMGSEHTVIGVVIAVRNAKNGVTWDIKTN